MLMLLSALTLILAAVAYAVAICNRVAENNLRYQYAVNYVRVRTHHY